MRPTCNVAPAALQAAWAAHRVPLMSALTARLGCLDRAEDALSEAALRAHRSWAASIPANPSGWLYRVALNAAHDRYRRELRHARAAPSLLSNQTDSQDDTLEVSPETRLALFRLCADPILSRDQQIALMLFHLAGLDCGSIARAFLVSEPTIHQRLSRAREKLRHREPDIEPDADMSAVRSALEVIYLQGYRDAAGGPEADALGRDALQLAAALCDAGRGDAESWGLYALLNCLESRRQSRLSDDGCFVPFDGQDVSRWSARAMRHTAAAMKTVAALGQVPQPYAIRAQIEMTRMVARREGYNCDADLLALHDYLSGLTHAPFAGVDRALVLARLKGAKAGLEALDILRSQSDLSDYAGWHLAKADLYRKMGNIAQARAHMTSALTLVRGSAERGFVVEALRALSA
jgi:RNA polymerase sigma-70 factor (ECF subfamily)